MSEEREQEERIVDMDSLFADEVISQEQVEQIIKDSQAPAGTYQSDPDEYPLMAYPEEREEKDVDGQVTGKRKSVSLTGMVFARIKGEDVKARIRFRISPQDRKAKLYDGDNWTGEYKTSPDSQSKLYAQAAKAYVATVGDVPKTVPVLVEFLRTVPVRFRLMPGRDGEPIVLAISPVGRRK